MTTRSANKPGHLVLTSVLWMTRFFFVASALYGAHAEQNDLVSAVTGAEGTRRLAGSSGGPIDAWWHAEQRAAALERSSAAAVGEEAEVADADQAFGKDMDQKAAQELIGGNGHDTEKCYKNGVFSNFDLANLGQTQSPAI